MRTRITTAVLALLVAGTVAASTGVSASASGNISDGWFSEDFTIESLGPADSATSFNWQPEPCRVAQVAVISYQDKQSICARSASFGWLDPTGIMRFKDGTSYRRINMPSNIYLLASEDTDTVFVVDKDQIKADLVQLRYYENFTNHLTWNTDGTLSLDDNYYTQTIETTSYQTYRQPTIISKIQNGRVLITYDKFVGWADLSAKTNGIIQGMPSMYNYYMAPLGQAISPDGRTAVTGYSTSGYDQENYGLSFWSTYACSFDSPSGSCRHRSITQQLLNKFPDMMDAIPLKFNGNNSLDIVVTFYDGSPTIYRLSIDPFAPINLLAMGDSFASGEGAYNYLKGTDEPDGNKCHSSLLAYSRQLNDQAVSVACSGAVINDANGQNPPKYSGSKSLPGETNQLDSVKYNYPKSTIISLGGNDIGFAQIVKACIDPIDHWRIRPTCYSSYEDRRELANLIDSQQDRLVDLYSKILQNTQQLFVVGYPQIVNPDGNCSNNVMLNDSERKFANQLTDYLNKVIKLSADKAGAIYVDVSEALAGHKLCDAGSPAVNGVTLGNDMLNILGRNWLAQESFHPNWYGQQLLALSIQKQTYGLNSKPDYDDKETDLGGFLDAPKTNRQIYSSIYDNSVAADYFNAGDELEISLKQSNEGFMPGSQVEPSLQASNAQTYSVEADYQGNVSGGINIPPTTPEGYSAIHLRGLNRASEPIDFYKFVYISKVDSANELPGLYLSVGLTTAVLPDK